MSELPDRILAAKWPHGAIEIQQRGVGCGMTEKQFLKVHNRFGHPIAEYRRATQCVWIPDEPDCSERWSTECGSSVWFEDDGPEGSETKFCHKCGGSIVIQEEGE